MKISITLKTLDMLDLYEVVLTFDLTGAQTVSVAPLLVRWLSTLLDNPKI